MRIPDQLGAIPDDYHPTLIVDTDATYETDDDGTVHMTQILGDGWTCNTAWTDSQRTGETPSLLEYRRHGHLADPLPYQPARVTWSPTVRVSKHYQNGELHDPADGSPAWRAVNLVSHVTFETRRYQHGQLHDLEPSVMTTDAEARWGSAAVVRWSLDGTEAVEERRYNHGKPGSRTHRDDPTRVIWTPGVDDRHVRITYTHDTKGVKIEHRRKSDRPHGYWYLHDRPNPIHGGRPVAARTTFHPNRESPATIEHFIDGLRQDPPDGTPAWRRLDPRGHVVEARHYQAGQPIIPSPPAVALDFTQPSSTDRSIQR